jgi:hypothetical protein
MKESIPAKRYNPGKIGHSIALFFQETLDGGHIFMGCGQCETGESSPYTDRIKWLKKYILSISGLVIHTRTP